MKQLFLESDNQLANKELDCYGYLTKKSIELFMQTDFEKAAAYHENIARTLNELGRLKRKKERDDQLRQTLKEVKAKHLLYKIQVNIYE